MARHTHWAPLRLASAGLLIAGALLLPAEARADVGVVGVDPAVGAPGDVVELAVGCGGCPRGLRLPVSLVPLARMPRPERCGANVICEPRAASAPKRSPFLPVGRTGRDSRLRFLIPQGRPGRYAFVLYCAPCYRGAGGSLISSDEDADVLRIHDRPRLGLLGSFLLRLIAALRL